jgi:hypothetical protein
MGKARKDKKKRKVALGGNDKEMLQELATVDDVTAWIPTDKDHVGEAVPKWCELVLEIKRTDDGSLTPSWPLNARLPLRRHDGELIIEVLDDVLHPNRANGAADRVWAALDESIDRIMKRVNKGKDPHDEDKGMASGLTRALALLIMPFDPDEDTIKDIAMDRYAIRNRLK